MSKFNEKSKGKNTTVNHEGEIAYKISPELELFSFAATSMSADKFYENFNRDAITRLKKLIKICDPVFVAKLAVYCRQELNLRSIPLIILTELAKIHNGDNLISLATERVIMRADEITEILACYQYSNSRDGLKKLNKMSNQMKKGISNAFHKFNEYQFSKYNRKTDVRLRDALFLTHPKPKDDKEAELFKKIASDTLEIPITWETVLSEEGKKGDSANKTKIWEKLIDENKLGYFALLRNLRNILNANVSREYIEKVIIKLTSPPEIVFSRVLPFRYLAAYRELNNTNALVGNVYLPAINTALDEALKISSKNLEFNESDNILIASDVSASMQSSITEKSSVNNYDIGLLLSMMLRSKCKFVTSGMFGDRWEVNDFKRTDKNVLEMIDYLYSKEGCVGYSTNGFKVLEWALEQKTNYDKIMIFTDCQMWNSDDAQYIRKKMQNLWNEYRVKNPNAKLYLFDLQGYFATPLVIDEKNVFLISGFSEKIFSLLNLLDNGGNIIDEVHKKIQL